LGITIYNRSNTENTSVKQQRDSRNAIFLYFQVLIDILLKLDDNLQETSAKQDLIDHFKRVYDGNQSVLQIIEEFEQQYEPNKAVWWYTRPEFLYSTLNKALRESDYEILFVLRFYISDLQQQLTQEHQRLLNSYSSDATGDHIFRVYRGQAIAADEMELIRQSIGEFISMQSFLSTTTDRDIAAFFAESSTPIIDDVTRILFEFNIDTDVAQTKSYANIRHLSYFRNEEEVLLMLGSIFKIERVEFDETAQLWSAILSLCSEDSYELKDLMTQVKKDTSAGVASLGWLLYRQGEFEKATTYFQHLLDKPSLSDFDRACSYRGLGGIAIRELAYDQALSYHQKELELRIKFGTNEELAKTYMAIGQAYYWRQEHDLALETAQKALSLLPENHLERADIYGTIASVYKDKKEWNLSLDYFSKELEIKQRLLPENYADIGLTLCNIGALYFDQDQTQMALEYFLKARTIFLKSLPPRHPRIITIEEYILLAENQ
jgi:tetratricopeptide (TPR) repeat protein